MRRWLVGWLLLIAAVAGLVHEPRGTRACSPTATPEGAPTETPITVEARIQLADVIFEGTVVGHEHGGPYGPAIVQVVSYLKGEGPELVLIADFGGPGQCAPVARIGDHAVFFTSGDPYARLRLTPGRPFESAGPRMQARVAGVVGHQPVVPVGTNPVLEQADWATKTPEPCCGKARAVRTEQADNQILWLGIAGGAFVLGLGLALWGLWRQRWPA